MDMSEVVLHTQNELDAIRMRVGTVMVDMVDRSVQAMARLSERLDEIDAAMAALADPKRMTTEELMAYTLHIRESFKLRQDFLKTLSGYDMDMSRAPVQAEARPAMDEEAAAAYHAEMVRRGQI